MRCEELKNQNYRAVCRRAGQCGGHGHQPGAVGELSDRPGNMGLAVRQDMFQRFLNHVALGIARGDLPAQLPDTDAPTLLTLTDLDCLSDNDRVVSRIGSAPLENSPNWSS